jgi:hypothetical protein
MLEPVSFFLAPRDCSMGRMAGSQRAAVWRLGLQAAFLRRRWVEAYSQWQASAPTIPERVLPSEEADSRRSTLSAES